MYAHTYTHIHTHIYIHAITNMRRNRLLRVVFLCGITIVYAMAQKYFGEGNDRHLHVDSESVTPAGLVPRALCAVLPRPCEVSPRSLPGRL